MQFYTDNGDMGGSHSLLLTGQDEHNQLSISATCNMFTYYLTRHMARVEAYCECCGSFNGMLTATQLLREHRGGYQAKTCIKCCKSFH